jgi:geranylgeranyl reductase family protein
MTYDAIVVGVGPGGAMAAQELRRHGLSVLALERARHPRHKSCGGGLSFRVHQLLEPGFMKVVQEEIDKVRFTFSGREEFVVPFPQPVAYMVLREEFDRYLAEQAVAFGAVLREAEPVESVQERSDLVEVKTARNTYQARYVIGADGANSTVARSICIKSERRPAFSLESEINLQTAAAPIRREVLIELGHIPGGYAWIFPKEACLSVGIAGFVGKGGRPRDYYRRFVQGQKRLIENKMGPVLGYPIPLFHRSTPPLASSRLAVVGDAAQLVDPLFGEGIYYALWSGQMAARYVAEAIAGRISDLTGYDYRIRSELYPELRSAYWMAKAVYRFPYLTFRTFRDHPEIIQQYYRVLRGEIGYRGLATTLHRMAWKFFWKVLLKKFRLQ